MSKAFRAVDPFMGVALTLAAPALWLAARARARAPISRRVLDRLHVSVVRHHYYEPVVYPADLFRPLSQDRNLPGVEFNVTGQLDLVREFHYRDELLAIPLEKPSVGEFGYNNRAYESGDAEMLYNVIRHFKPKRLVEIGSGQSTLLARRALSQNQQEGAPPCRHICVEPYEQPWLETLGIEVVRERVERCGWDVFNALEAGDILFVDSSHVIRPQGDVLFEYLELFAQLKPGVLIHIHDIFTPRDYPETWVLNDRRMWNEQYLLEAFLSFNPVFEVLLAVNWLSHNHAEALSEACPVLLRQVGREPGAFWMRRKVN